MSDNQTDEQTLDLDELKKEASDLGISFGPRISASALKERIEQFYDNSAGESVVTEKEEEEEEEKTAPAAKASGKRSFRTYVDQQRREAEKTRIITIIDNDSRENNLTTTVTVTAVNGYFSLGTVLLPLNEKVEVRQGHINVLKEIKIPQHVRSQKDPSVSETVLRPRYTIQYED